MDSSSVVSITVGGIKFFSITVGGITFFLTLHSLILVFIISGGILVDVLNLPLFTHNESNAIICESSYHVHWGHAEKDGGNWPQPWSKETYLDETGFLHDHFGHAVGGERDQARRIMISMASKSILPLLQWILLMDLEFNSDGASGINMQLANCSATFLLSEYICLAVLTTANIFALFFAAWTFRRQGLHWTVYWSCLPLLILATSWTHIGGSPANFALIQLPLCVSVGISLTGFQHLVMHWYQSGHPQPLN